jgi:CheY-like chemotaxis protein
LFSQGSAPKLILLDLVLPVIDGIELYHIIKAEPKERNLTVVALITSINTKNYLESINVHPDGYLKKPTQEELPVRV